MVCFFLANVAIDARKFQVVVLMLQTQCSYGDPDNLEFALDGRMYELDYNVVDGDMDRPEYALAGTDLTTQGK